MRGRLRAETPARRPGRARGSRELLLRLVRYGHFGRSNILYNHRCGAVLVEIVAVEAHGAFNLELVFGERPVFEPELHRTFRIGDRGTFASAAWPKREQGFGS